MNFRIWLTTLALVATGMTGTAAAQEAAPADAAESTEAAEADAADAAGAEEAPAEGEATNGEPAEAVPGADSLPQPEGTLLGPGGKPLRTDYPGTEESLKARMDTDRIQGLEVDPNQPQEAYTMRIQELETKIDDLKEKVFQSKSRIVLLRETLLSGNLAGARAIIVHKTDMGAAFKLREALYSLDGTKLFHKLDKDGNLADKTAFEVYNGGISPGTHNLSVTLKYQGSGYGLFTYFEGYDFDIRQSCQFKADEGKIVQVKSIAFEKGNIATSKEDRPYVKCEIQYFDNIQEGGDGGQNVAEDGDES